MLDKIKTKNQYQNAKWVFIGVLGKLSIEESQEQYLVTGTDICFDRFEQL
jgi:hypothetical protein